MTQQIDPMKDPAVRQHIERLFATQRLIRAACRQVPVSRRFALMCGASRSAITDTFMSDLYMARAK